MNAALRVLIADDDPIARRFLESAVSRAGYEAVVVSAGDEAWRVLSAEDGPGVAVLDWMMPGLTGIEVCEKVRAAGLRIPPYLIMLTSRGATDDVVRPSGRAPTTTSPSPSSSRSCGPG